MSETNLPEPQKQMQLYSPTSAEAGSILINPDVIARIAGMAVAEVQGVALISKSWMADILPGKEVVKGILVQQNDSGRYSIICEVKMAYKTPMRETAERLQRHVKETVERMAGLDLAAVDVKIVDIFIEREGRPERDLLPGEEED